MACGCSGRLIARSGGQIPCLDPTHLRLPKIELARQPALHVRHVCRSVKDANMGVPSLNLLGEDAQGGFIPFCENG